MEVNFVEPKDFSFGKFFIDLINGIIILELVSYGLLFLIFYFTYYLKPSNVEVINSVINGLTYSYFWVIPLIVLIMLFLGTFLELNVRFRCEVCGKRDYLSNMKPVSKWDAESLKEDRTDTIARVVCRVHKKPYLKEIK